MLPPVASDVGTVVSLADSTLVDVGSKVGGVMTVVIPILNVEDTGLVVVFVSEDETSTVECERGGVDEDEEEVVDGRGLSVRVGAGGTNLI